jgi:hypothetical protein
LAFREFLVPPVLQESLVSEGPECLAFQALKVSKDPVA